MRNSTIKLKTQKKCINCGVKFKLNRTTDVLCSLKCYGEYNAPEKVKARHEECKKAVKGDAVSGTLQDLINTIVRLIDRGHPDISGNRPFGSYKVAAGHAWSVGAHPKIRYNLLNIFAQDWSDNGYKGGMAAEYFVNLGNTFGPEVKKEIEGLPLKYKDAPRLTKLEAKNACKIAGQIIKELKQHEPIFSTDMRIEVRRKLNERLGIYR